MKSYMASAKDTPEPLYCEACGHTATAVLQGTFGTLCAACVERISGHTLDDLAGMDPAAQVIRPLTAEDERRIIAQTMAQYGPSPEDMRRVARFSVNRHRGPIPQEALPNER